MDAKYWKVILRYGHVGRRREVSVVRYLQTDAYHTAIDVMDLASEMPGVKSSGVSFLAEIDESTYLQGKPKENENLYLKKLMTFNKRSINRKLESELIC